MRFTIFVAAAGLAGCAASASTPVGLPTQTLPTLAASLAAAHARDAVSPETCDRGEHVLFRQTGGVFRMPGCAGWTGKIGYPPTGTSHFLVTTSVTNSFGVPAPPSGTAIFYMATALRRPDAVLELDGTSGMATVTSPRLTAAHSYTLMVYALFYDDQCRQPPCPPWVANIGSPRPGKHSITFASPLNDAGIQPSSIPVWQFIQNS
jgi:hypothetical protein